MRKDLPAIRGLYRFDAPLKGTNWFGVGGPAEVLFKPADAVDLAQFLREVSGSGFQVSGSEENSLKPETRNLKPLPITVIGVGSNLIVRDGGILGVVIRLGRGFTEMKIEGDVVEAGAAVLDLHLARYAGEAGRAGLEFFAGIPGTIGGALAMNAGAYGRETKDVLLRAEAVTPQGEIVMLNVEDMRYAYRKYNGPEGLIFTRAWFRTTADSAEAVAARIKEIQAKREATQPIRERTGGSTFKNPTDTPPPVGGRWGGGRHEGNGANSVTMEQIVPPLSPSGGGITPKAWQLIDAAGCRGLTIGGAQMSELHCNFMINTGTATAADLEVLGEEVRARVKAHSGVELQWEIKRIGVPLPQAGEGDEA